MRERIMVRFYPNETKKNKRLMFFNITLIIVNVVFLLINIFFLLHVGK